MNEQVEMIYTQMFAPDPIPEDVKELYKRFNFYASRIDQLNIRPLDLAMVATMATCNVDLKPSVPIMPQGTINARETDKPDEQEPVPAPQPGAPTGPMDAPNTFKGDPQTDLQLHQLTATELRNHIKTYYPQIKVPHNQGKARMIAAIKAAGKG